MELQTESVCIDELAPDDLREYAAYLRDTLARVTGADGSHVPGLSAAQSRVIRALEAAQGRTLSVPALMDALYWDRPPGAEEPDSKIISVIIHHIRRRRPDLGARIETYWGSGYRLAPGDDHA